MSSTQKLILFPAATLEAAWQDMKIAYMTALHFSTMERPYIYEEPWQITINTFFPHPIVIFYFQRRTREMKKESKRKQKFLQALDAHYMISGPCDSKDHIKAHKIKFANDPMMYKI